MVNMANRSGNGIDVVRRPFGPFMIVMIALLAGLGTARAENPAADPPDQDAMVAIGGRGWILPRQGTTGVTVQTVNTPLVRIRVLRVSERSLVGDGTRTRPDPAKQSFMLYELHELADGQATEIWSGTMQTNAGRNRLVETAFPLAGIIDPAKPGAYLILAEDAASRAATLTSGDVERRDYWREYNTSIAGHWVLSTDIALTTLQGQDGLHVAVRSLATAAPQPGVRLQLLSRARDSLAEAVSDAAGEALFAPGLLRGRLGASPAVLLARTDAGDVMVQDLTAPAFDLSDRGAAGRVSPGPIEAYVYTDRGIYRPGEVVQVTALLRTRGLSAVDDAGLTLVLRRPDGVEASRATLPPAPDAGFQLPIKLTATAAQGNWTVEAFVDPSLPPVGRATIAVQDFVPQQLKVALAGPSAPLAAGANLTASIDGRFLYGAPAAGLHAEGDVKLVRDEHPVADARDYVFGDPQETIADATQTLKLDDADAAGHVVIDVALTMPDGMASPLRAILDAGLTEPGGRAVRQSLSVPLRNHALLIGVRKLFGDHVDQGKLAQFAVRAFDVDGKPVARTGLHWRLVRVDRRWDWWRGQSGGSGWTYHYYTVENEVARGTLDVGADRPSDLDRAADWGEYRLIVSDASSGAATSAGFSVGWTASTTDADVPDRLEVSTDRAVVGVGQVAHVHLRGPIAGPAQVIVESAGRVLETRRVDLPREGATINLTASDAWGAGVHVLAEAFRPQSAQAGAHDPMRAVGLAWIATDPALHTLAVTIGAPPKTTPRQTVGVPVHVAGAHGRAFVTLAAVDEGILQLTHFASPDPVATLLGRTRFDLDLRDDYGRLLDGHANVGALHEGGDEGAALGGQGLPVTTTRTVALFHGPLELDANGDATVPLDLPDFSGELRLMAVAYDHDAAGHAEMAMTVRDPVVAELALPRFLAPGDAASVGISLHDTDGPAGDYRLALATSGAVGFRGISALEMYLEPGERQQTHIDLSGRGVGIGHIEATLTGPGGLRIAHQWDITVRSPHPDLVLSQTAAQQPGEVYTPDPALFVGFVPGSARVTIGYSNLVGIDVPGLLQSLYTYPYGCTEQLSSSAFPLLYFNDARLLGRPGDDSGIHARVQAAIDTIIDRQNPEGRFGLWHVGDRAASVWLNVYALDFLLHAREAGFKVPESATAAATRWVDRNLANDEVDRGGAYAQPTEPTRAYAAYVLARTDRVDPSRLRALASGLDWSGARGAVVPQSVSWRNVGPASPLSLAHLAGAQSLMGAPGVANDTFALAYANLDTSSPPGWWHGAFFWSELRDEAGLLAIAVETGHDDIAAALLARIDRLHPNPEAMNTQEKAWLLSAAHALSKRKAAPALSVDGAPAQPMTLPFAVSRSGEETARGLSVRNADAKALFRTVTVRGAPIAGPPALSNGFTLTRQTLTLNGDPLDDTKLHQTDRFIVVLSGTAEHDIYRRAVVDDPLPAGWEIETAVLRKETYPFLGQLTTLRAHEERDDRFVAAFDVGADNYRYHYREVDDSKTLPLADGEFRVAYVVRAVTPGRFVQPETVVQDMYRPDIMARTASRQTDVAPR